MTCATGHNAASARTGVYLPLLALALVGFILGASDVRAQSEITAEVGIETRGFPRAPLSDQQGRNDFSITVLPEFFYDWDGGYQSVVFEPFVRLDANDGRRTHFDVRELSWAKAWPTLELRIGIRKVYWGVTESQHLVDIINQTDLVENLDGEDKLGQPMINAALIRSWGTLEIFLLPWFRERTFPGRDGRLRFPVPVATDNAVYQSNSESHHFDWAARWSHFIGSWDIGVSHFVGTSRDPRLVPGSDESGTPVLIPHYDLINQTGVDVQYTTGGWLWKLEGITRSIPDDRYVALTGGFEYTIPQVLGTNADLGLIAEYLFDDRGSSATTPFEDDVTAGGRLALNDTQSTEVLAFVVADRSGDGNFVSIEGSRRVSDGWTVSLEARAFIGVDSSDPLYGLRRDEYVGIKLTRYF